MPKPSDKWTRDEHILAFNLYCKIPFGRQHSRAPEIMDLAKLMGRSPGSVALKLNNFSRLDPELQARGIKGMAHGAKDEIDVTRAFRLILNNPQAAALQIICRRIKTHRRPGRIGCIAWRNPNHEALTRACEQHTIGVQKITAINLLVHLAPSSSTEAAAAPTAIRVIESEIPAPTHSNPVQFQPLALEFGRRYFELIRGTHVWRFS